MLRAKENVTKILSLYFSTIVMGTWILTRLPICTLFGLTVLEFWIKNKVLKYVLIFYDRLMVSPSITAISVSFALFSCTFWFITLSMKKLLKKQSIQLFLNWILSFRKASAWLQHYWIKFNLVEQRLRVHKHEWTLWTLFNSHHVV